MSLRRAPRSSRSTSARLAPVHAMGTYIAETDPLVIARAEGSRLFDVDGRALPRRQLVVVGRKLGHNHPRLVAALTRQARKDVPLLARRDHAPRGGALADELCRSRRPGSRACSSATTGRPRSRWRQAGGAARGAERGARSDALRRARGAFHGETVGATSLGGVEVFRRPFAGILFDCIRVPLAWRRRAPTRARSKSWVERSIEGRDEIAAVVLEPLVQGAAGMRIYDAEYLRHARALCDRHEIPLVFDEVFTGYGRTGPMWACDSAGVSARRLVPRQGLLGRHVADVGDARDRAHFRGVSWATRAARFTTATRIAGNPLGAAVAREVLRMYGDEKILERAQAEGARNRRRVCRARRARPE